MLVHDGGLSLFESRIARFKSNRARGRANLLMRRLFEPLEGGRGKETTGKFLKS